MKRMAAELDIERAHLHCRSTHVGRLALHLASEVLPEAGEVLAADGLAVAKVIEDALDIPTLHLVAQ